MICHALEVISTAVRYLNPSQIPVTAFDQPLFALAKQVQWQWPERFGEGKLIVMFGGLHVELTALKAIGKWIEDSGWTGALVQSGIASSGTADSFLKASHVSKTRRAHQITASALKILMLNAYNSYCDVMEEPREKMSFEAWRFKRETESPQFQYWSITLDFELLIMIFVRSLQERNFELYKSALISLMPWFFALNHPNYSRWLSVHITDMISLQDAHPSVLKEFQDGNFVVHKTNHRYSSIAIDCAHEQHNKCVKGDGGAIGLMENSSELLRWMVSGPEIARAVNEFETDEDNSHQEQRHTNSSILHHDETKGVQKEFKKSVLKLAATITEMGNPFLETSTDLLVLDSRDIVDAEVAGTGLPGNKLAQVWHFAHLDNGRSVMGGAMDVLSFSTKAQLHSIWSHKKV